MSVTSYLCQWKVPKKQKESNLPMAAAVLEKHNCRKQKRGSSSSAVYWLGIKIFREGKSSLLLFLLSLIVFVVIRWVSLCFLTHSTATKPVTQRGVPDTPSLKETVSAFKDSLKVPADKLW